MQRVEPAVIRQINARAARGTWPAEADFILSAMEVACPWRSTQRGDGRRKHPRLPYRTKALLRLFSQPADATPHLLYTRDLSVRGLGLLTARPLPLGHEGTLHLSLPASGVLDLRCTVSRCAQLTPGWHEACVIFIEPLSDEIMKACESAR